MTIYTEIVQKVENNIVGRDYADNICSALRKVNASYKRKDEKDYITIRWELQNDK